MDLTTDHRPLTTEVELPCGVLREGELVREAEITGMSGRVRKQIARRDVRANGAKITDAVLLGCVKSIGGARLDRNSLRDLLLGDRDFLVLKIRQLARDGLVQARMQCQACQVRFPFTIDLGEIEVFRLEEGDYELADGRTRVFRLTNEQLSVAAAFRYPNGADQHAVSTLVEENPVEAQYTTWNRCLEEWNGRPGPFPRDFIEGQPVDVLDWLEEEFTAAMPGPEMEHEVICDSCGARNPMNLGASDFLFPQRAEEPRRRARKRGARR